MTYPSRVRDRDENNGKNEDPDEDEPEHPPSIPESNRCQDLRLVAVVLSLWSHGVA